MIKSASVAELRQWMESNEVTLVDVREPDEYAHGSIAGSTLLPLATVTASALPAFKGKKLVMQCRSGGRSRTACGKLLQELPDQDIYNLEGGIMAWIQAGYEINM